MSRQLLTYSLKYIFYFFTINFVDLFKIIFISYIDLGTVGVGGEGKVEKDSIGNLNFFNTKRNYNFGFFYALFSASVNQRKNSEKKRIVYSQEKNKVHKHFD